MLISARVTLGSLLNYRYISLCRVSEMGMYCITVIHKHIDTI